MLKYAFLGLLVFPYNYFGEAWLLIAPLCMWLGVIVFEVVDRTRAVVRAILGFLRTDDAAAGAKADPPQIERK